MTAPRSYLLCATPRSGTTLLCDLLSGTGAAGRPNSYYRAQDIGRRAKGWGLSRAAFADDLAFERAYLAQVLREGRGGTDVFGLRIMWGTVAEAAARLAPLYPDEDGAPAIFAAAFGPVRYVHVSRGDKLGQAISLVKAEQSGLWHMGADGTERERSAPTSELRYDGARIAEVLAEREADDTAWDRFFDAHEITPVRVTYEALAAAPQDELRRILGALDLDPGLADAAPVRTAKLADDTSAAWAERFRRET